MTEAKSSWRPCHRARWILGQDPGVRVSKGEGYSCEAGYHIVCTARQLGSSASGLPGPLLMCLLQLIL